MSTHLKTNVFTIEEKTRILKDLEVKSVDKYIPDFSGKGKKLAPTTIIKCFKTMKKGEESYVAIPFSYMCKFRNKIYNKNKKHSFLSLPLPPSQDENEKKNIFKGEPRDYQEDVIEEALLKLGKKHSVSLDLPTSYGKTFISIYLACKLGYSVCILNYRETIQTSWINEIEKRINKEDLRLFVVGDKRYKKETNPNIILCLVGSTHKIPQEWIDGVGTLIIDECHVFNTEKRIESVLSFTPRYIIGLSATQELESGLHKAINLIIGDEKIKREQVKPYDAYIINTHIKYDTLDYVEYIGQQAECPDRISLIEKIISQNKEHKIMVIASRTELCDKIGDVLYGKDTYAKLYKNIKSYEDSRVLLGTFGKMGTGFDESNFCDDFEFPSNLGIVTFTNTTFAPFTQAKGRVMRSDNPILVYFNDDNFISKKHIRQMREWIKDSKGTVYEIDYYKESECDLNLNKIKMESNLLDSCI
jgi:hypothetical protein